MASVPTRINPTKVTGAYKVTWGGDDLGLTLSGFTPRFEPAFLDIFSDAGGGPSGTVVDQVPLGGQCFIDFDWLEFTLMETAEAFFEHWQSGRAGFMPDNPIFSIGLSMLDTYSRALILTPVPDSGNADDFIAAPRTKGHTFTFFKTWPVDTISWNMSTSPRVGSITFRVVPSYDDTYEFSTGAAWFKTEETP